MRDDATFESRFRSAAAEATALPAPGEAWERIVARIQRGDEVLLPAGETPGHSHESVARSDRSAGVATRSAGDRGAWRAARAAGLVLVAGMLGIAAALPASPLRSWLDALFGGPAAQHAEPAPSGGPPMLFGDAETTGSGSEAEAGTLLVLDPVDGGAVVALVAPGGGVRIRVRFADVEGLEVDARGGVATAQFRSALGQLTIAEAAAGDLVLTIPSRLARLRILVDGRAYLTKENGQIRVHSPAADTVGSEIVLPVIR